MNDIIKQFDTIASSTNVLMSRVTKSDGTYLQQSDVASIRVDLYDLADEFSQPMLSSTGAIIQPTARTPVDNTGTPITTGAAYDTPAASTVVTNSLQTDVRWSVDSVGYNVAYKVAAPIWDHIYEVRITLALANADTVVLAYQLASR